MYFILALFFLCLPRASSLRGLACVILRFYRISEYQRKGVKFVCLYGYGIGIGIQVIENYGSTTGSYTYHSEIPVSPDKGLRYPQSDGDLLIGRSDLLSIWPELRQS